VKNILKIKITWWLAFLISVVIGSLTVLLEILLLK